MYLVPTGRWGSADPGGQREGTRCLFDDLTPSETQIHLDYLGILIVTFPSPLACELPAPSSGEVSGEENEDINKECLINIT